MLRDVTITISDGQMGVDTAGEGVHLKIGASPVVSEELITIRGSYSPKQIKDLLGNCPLADACMDSVEHGSALIYCMPVAPSTVGTIGTVTKGADVTSTITVSGSPTNAYDVLVTITEPGEANAAAFTYSINGGFTKSDEITIPSSGSYTIPDTGITIAFASEYKEGDTFSFTTTAPGLTNDDILSALDRIRNLKETFEIVHIVGETAQATWAAIAVKQTELQKIYKLPLMFVLEAYAPMASQTAQEYAKSLIAARKGIGNTDLQIVAARGMYQRMDGIVREINLAGIVCGLYARAKVQQSIGRTSEFAIAETKLQKLTPDGIDDQIEYLDDADYLTLRQYIGLSGYYVTNARMMHPEGSDYKYAEHTRVKNKIMRKIRKEALLQLHAEVDMSDVDGSLQTIAKFLETPLDEMVAAKEISAGRIIIPDGQDILTTEKLQLLARFTPKGYVREFEIDLGMERLV